MKEGREVGQDIRGRNILGRDTGEAPGRLVKQLLVQRV